MTYWQTGLKPWKSWEKNQYLYTIDNEFWNSNQRSRATEIVLINWVFKILYIVRVAIFAQLVPVIYKVDSFTEYFSSLQRSTSLKFEY